MYAAFQICLSETLKRVDQKWQLSLELFSEIKKFNKVNKDHVEKMLDKKKGNKNKKQTQCLSQSKNQNSKHNFKNVLLTVQDKNEQCKILKFKKVSILPHPMHPSMFVTVTIVQDPTNLARPC